MRQRGWWAKWRARAEALRNEVYALYLAYRDPRTPWAARLWGALVVAYALSPIDLIPDFIPILGYLDDFLLVPLGIALALRLIPPAVMDDCRRRAQGTLSQRPFVAWIASGLIVALWLLVALGIWRAVGAYIRAKAPRG